MNAIIQAEKSLTKKETRELIYNRLTEAMGEFKPLIKQKKFESGLLKITKLFAADITKASRKMKMKKSGKKDLKKTEAVNEK